MQWLMAMAQKLGRPEFESTNSLTVGNLRNLIPKFLMFFKRDHKVNIVYSYCELNQVLCILYYMQCLAQSKYLKTKLPQCFDSLYSLAEIIVIGFDIFFFLLRVTLLLILTHFSNLTSHYFIHMFQAYWKYMTFKKLDFNVFVHICFPT